MKKTLVCMVMIISALCAEVCLASGEGVIYTQNFDQFTESADGSSAPNGLSVLNSQGVEGGSGVYSADEVYTGAALIKTNADSANVSLIYTFPDSAPASFSYEASVLVENTNTKRTITVFAGEESADIVTFGNGGYVYAGSTRVYGLKLEAGKTYKIKASYTQADGRVTVKIIHNSVEYISQGTAALSGGIVQAVGIRVPEAVESNTYVDNIRLMYSYEYDELLYADNFETYGYSAASGNDRWPKGNVSYTSNVTSEYGTNMKITKTSSNDANVETTLYGNNTVFYTGTDDIYYNISLKFDDFNCIRHITVRDNSATSSYKYTRSFGYVDQNGQLFWDGMKQDYKFETGIWYHIGFVYNRATGDGKLTVSDSQRTFSCTAESVWRLGTLTRIGIELKGLTGTSSVMYIDNASLWLKPAVSNEAGQKTNWYESELNTLSSVDDADTSGRAVLINGGAMIELRQGEHINYTSEATGAQVFVADVYITEPVALAVAGDGEELVCFTEDFKIKAQGAILGSYTAGKTYRIFITNNSGADARYISVSEGRGRLVGFARADAARNTSFKIQNSLNKAYIDNIGLADSGKTVLPIIVSPAPKAESSVSFAEFTFPTYIDAQSVSVLVNGSPAEARFLGDKTVRLENLEKDSYYHITITDASDLLGNSISADIEFSTGKISADIGFPLRAAKTGSNPIKLTIK